MQTVPLTCADGACTRCQLSLRRSLLSIDWSFQGGLLPCTAPKAGRPQLQRPSLGGVPPGGTLQLPDLCPFQPSAAHQPRHAGAARGDEAAGGGNVHEEKDVLQYADQNPQEEHQQCHTPG